MDFTSEVLKEDMQTLLGLCCELAKLSSSEDNSPIMHNVELIASRHGFEITKDFEVISKNEKKGKRSQELDN
jgi:hypothetical protein